MTKFTSTKVIPLGSCAFRQPYAKSHCKFLHGYRLEAKFTISAEELDSNNWIYDFGGFKELKAILENTFDHKTIIWSKDPELQTFYDLEKRGIIDLVVLEDGVGIEKFAKYCFDVANAHITATTNGRCWCDKVEVWEHEQNSACYENVEDYITIPVQSAKSDEVIISLLKQEQIPEHTPVIANNQVTAVTSNQEEAKLNVPPLNLKKTYNTYKGLFDGTSWGTGVRK
jgi:6-pyruvoyltetrahydropterin/6-carboxytetrahydropterin synthase